MMARPDDGAPIFCNSIDARHGLIRKRSTTLFVCVVLLAGASAAYAAVEVKTGRLNFTGTRAPLTGAPAGTAINVATGKILFTGTRVPLTAPTSTTGPVDVRTPGMSFNGTNSM